MNDNSISFFFTVHTRARELIRGRLVAENCNCGAPAFWLHEHVIVHDWPSDRLVAGDSQDTHEFIYINNLVFDFFAWTWKVGTGTTTCFDAKEIVWTGSSINSTLTVSCLVLCFDLPDFHHATQKWFFFPPVCQHKSFSLSGAYEMSTCLTG